jgi:high-affinity iron transporter
MSARTFLLPLAATAALGLAACGDDDKDSEATEHQSTPAQAVAEIGEVRTALDQALATYKAGDKAAAEEQVATAYLEHFEKVEGPLEKVDHELMEDIEGEISTAIRTKMKAGAPVSEVAAQISDVKRELATAEAKLK